MSDHVHDWYLPQSFISIDTYPLQYAYECRGCDLVTHDPKTGAICAICRRWSYVPAEDDGSTQPVEVVP